MLFIIAVTSILFFPELDIASFSPRTLAENAQNRGKELLLQDQTDWRPKEPEPVEPDLEIELFGSGEQEKLHPDDPLIKSIEKLRRGLADNYKVE